MMLQVMITLEIVLMLFVVPPGEAAPSPDPLEIPTQIR
jgi:hypothetical protein